MFLWTLFLWTLVVPFAYVMMRAMDARREHQHLWMYAIPGAMIATCLVMGAVGVPVGTFVGMAATTTIVSKIVQMLVRGFDIRIRKVPKVVPPAGMSIRRIDDDIFAATMYDDFDNVGLGASSLAAIWDYNETKQQRERNASIRKAPTGTLVYSTELRQLAATVDGELVPLQAPPFPENQKVRG